MTENCGSCKFWLYMNSRDRARKGLCREGPPARDNEHNTGTDHWPRTLEDDWCGKWSYRLKEGEIEVEVD